MSARSERPAAAMNRGRTAAFVMTLLAALIAIVLLYSMNVGAMRLSPQGVMRTLLGSGTGYQEMILFDFRMPRIVISILIGAGFAISGCILQGVTRNALADPGILGINAGAGLAVILFIAFYADKSGLPVFGVPLFAFIGAAATAALIYSLSYVRGEGISPYRMLLNGIAVAAGIVALITVLSIRLDHDDFQFVAIWVAGTIWGSNWKFVLALLPWLLVLIPYAMWKARVLDVLSLGDPAAMGLGAPVERERLRLYGAAVALAGACVAVGGGIGFVGLIAPHLARRLVGPQHRFALPASALIGALLLVVSDTLARLILQPTEIPTGIIVAVMGAPYFLYLLARSRG